MSAEQQTFANHARYVPGYHFVAALILAVNLGFAVWQVVKQPSAASGIGAGVAVALLLMWWYLRAFAVKVQDRVIRLEEQLRMQRLLPPDLQERAAELTPKQLAALRFAGDDELADVVRWTLEHRPGRTRLIKERVKNWRPDHLRA